MYTGRNMRSSFNSDSLAQLAEHRIPDPKVVGSNPAWVMLFGNPRFELSGF